MSVYVPSPRAAKAEIGAGVVPMMYDAKFSEIFGQNDHARLKAAQLLYHANPWVNAAERAVTSKFANVEWHLEDENDDEITDDSKPGQVMARNLIEQPQAALPRTQSQGLTRRALWSITSRHMGLCGTTFWYGDQMDLFGIPTGFLYINPCRMTPVSNPAGYLIGYKLDAVPHDPNSGYPLTLDEVFKFDLDPGDMGHWGIGLAEAAGILGELWMLAARHSGGVLSSGGRLAGIMMPKPGTVMENDAWKSLVRDMRTISEDPNAAKRNLIIKQPMDFLPTAANAKDLDLIRSLDMSRDDILGYWGVPKSQIGLEISAGLNNGGSTKDRDLQVLWQGPVHSRLVSFAEVIQFQLLDRFKAMGLTIELEIEEPDFTEDKPKFDNANMALSQPLRNRERRELLGLDPFGDPVLDNAVWMPVQMTEMFQAPDEAGKIIEREDEEEPSTIEVKASKRVLMGLRRQVDAAWVPKLRRSVQSVLDDQRREVIAKVKRNAAHLMRKPTDTGTWWDAKRWDREMSKTLEGHASGITAQVTEHVASILGERKPKKAAPVWSDEVEADVITKIGKRVTGINETTRDAVLRTIQETVVSGINEGLGAAELGDNLEAALNDAKTFDEYRAELIARTETMEAYNSSALGSYGQYGIERVQALDGDNDEECAARNGQDFSLDEASGISDHPNGTLDWVPYFAEAAA